MRIQALTILLLGLLFIKVGYTQTADCTLGLGGKDTEVIKQVFQLSAAQKAQLDTWVVEYRTTSRSIQEEVDQLLASHPQKTPEDLEKMAMKYDTLKAELFGISKGYDQKLLALFNERQYQVYLELCNEVSRKPMRRARKER